jgi:hypothetical protein
MKKFKEYIIESAGGGNKGEPGVNDLPPGLDYTSAAYLSATPMSTAKGYVAALEPVTFTPYMYRSVYSPYVSGGLDPGQDRNNGRVSGGGGFEIEKQSRDYLIALAKRYGIDIETPESMQKKQQQQMGGQQQQMPMGGMGGQQQQGMDHYLYNQVKKHPAMYLLNQDQGLQKEFDKAFKSMLDWKTTTKNPDEGKDWYTLWKEKKKKEEDQHKVNLGRMATQLRFKEFSTGVHNRLNHMGLASDDLPHIKNYLDPSNHPMTHDQEQNQQSMNQDQNYGYPDDSYTNLDYGTME